MLALEMRPSSLEELVGQEPIKKILAKAVEERKIPQTMLFAGPHGVGKTSTARIIADIINADLIEIDVASNRGIESAHKLVELTNFVPQSDNVVIILDECHMMTREAFNALLKLLEEPPTGYYFILVTTDSTKMPKTILSRCYIFRFQKLGKDLINAELKRVVDKLGKGVDDDILNIIAESCDGSLRDAFNLLDQILLYGNSLDINDIQRYFGMASKEEIKKLFHILKHKDVNELIAYVDRLHAQGVNGLKFSYQILEILEGNLTTTKRIYLYKMICDNILKYEYATDDKVFMKRLFLEFMEVY